MSANNRDWDERPRHRDALAAFLSEPKEDLQDTLARIERKLDVLAAALVKPDSIIILSGKDIERFAAEFKKGGAA